MWRTERRSACDSRLKRGRWRLKEARRSQQMGTTTPGKCLAPKLRGAGSREAKRSSRDDVDCVWDDWVDWSVCQFTCGGGLAKTCQNSLLLKAKRAPGESVRTRKVKTMASGEGASWQRVRRRCEPQAACDSNDRETRVCNKNPCPVDCASWLRNQSRSAERCGMTGALGELVP